MKKRVQLHAQNRGVDVETDATVGAVVGENLFFKDGTLVTEEMLSNVGVATPSNPEAEVAPADSGGPSSGGSSGGVGGPVFWRTLMEVPENLEALAGLTGVGVVRRTGDFTFDLATTTTDVPEGTNLYYTNARVDARIALTQRFNQSSWLPSSGATITLNGLARTGVGTVSTPALAATNLSTACRRWRNTSAAVANSVADERSPVTVCWRGNAAGLGGWAYTGRFSLVTLQATSVGFFGMCASVAAFATTQTIAALVNCVGIGFTNGTNTNWQLLCNDAAGAPTAVDLGSNFPIAGTNTYTLTISAEPNDSSIAVRVVNETSGYVADYTLTTDIPAAATFLSVRNFLHNGGAAAAVAYDCSGVFLDTDY